jgi:hypothetical protein
LFRPEKMRTRIAPGLKKGIVTCAVATIEQKRTTAICNRTVVLIKEQLFISIPRCNSERFTTEGAETAEKNYICPSL